MPKSDKIRQQECRARKQQRNATEFREIEARRKRIQRAKERQLTRSQLAQKRESTKLRVRQFRQRKKLQALETEPKIPNVQPINPLSVYGSKQALGKAVIRAKRSLPISPRKRKIVVQKLAKNTGISVSAELNKEHHGNALSEESKQTVIDFYNRDDVSRMAPGKKDLQQSEHRRVKIMSRKDISLCHSKKPMLFLRMKIRMYM